MQEEELKNLINKSILNTSNSFTDSLMTKLEARQVYRKEMHLIYIQLLKAAVMVIVVGGAVLFTVLHFGFLPRFTLLDASFEFSKVACMVVGLLVLLLGLNHLLRIIHSIKLQ